MRASVRRQFVVTNEDGKKKFVPPRVDHSVSFSVECSCAPNAKQHRVEVGFDLNGAVLYCTAQCAGLDASSAKLKTILALGGRLCSEEAKKQARRLGEHIRGTRALDFNGRRLWYELYGKAVDASKSRRNLRIREGSRFVELTREDRFTQLVSKRATAYAGMPVYADLTLNEAQEIDAIALYTRSGDVGGSRFIAKRSAKGGAFFSGVNTPKNPAGRIYPTDKMWMAGTDGVTDRCYEKNEYCTCCRASYHPAYIERHLATAGHRNAAVNAAEKLVRQLNKSRRG
jgi:hypothetical protein